MAETFEAVRTGPSDFEQRVCLKLVLPFFQQSKEFLSLFHREAKLAARLRHGNIVGVIDFGEIGGKSYIALELVDGCDLRMLLDDQDRRRLTPEQVTLIGMDLAAALEHAHNPETRQQAKDGSGSVPRSIIHRDISPSNVLISCNGEVMLTDFGVATAISGTGRKQSAIKGKIPYMSPEQLRGDPLDGRSDLFALGVVMFEALSGERPHDGPNDPATIMSALRGDHPSLRSLAPRAPAELCDVVERLLLPNADERPQTAAEVTELLDELTPTGRTRRALGQLVARAPRAGEPLGRAESSSVGKSGRVLDGGRLAEGEEAPTPTLSRPERDPSIPMRSSSRIPMIFVAAASALVVLGGIAVSSWSERASHGTGPAVESASETPEPPANEAVYTPKPEAISPIQAAPPVETTAAASSPGEPPAASTKAAPRDPRTSGAKVSAAAPAPGSLTVIAIPWGKVWIDGRPAGASPLKDHTLKPGRYQVSAGQEGPSKTQTVRLRPGQKKTLRFDLTE